MTRKKFIMRLLACASAFCMVACGQQDKGVEESVTQNAEIEEASTTLPEQTEAVAESFVTIEAKYAKLQISNEFASYIRHKEVTQEAEAVEIFYMFSGDTERELFRLYFGNKAMGDMIGSLELDSGECPVSVASCYYSAEEFEDEEELSLYYSLMEELDTVISSIQADDRFKPVDSIVVPEISTATSKLTYWTFSLPENMECEELKYGGLYKLLFKGTVKDTEIELYSIYLGENDADTVLGTYTVDGVAMPVSVESYDIVPAESWSEEDLTTAYTMMSTINDVIQTIMSDANFSEQLPE